MPNKDPANRSALEQIVDRAFAQIQAEHGLSGRDLFMLALGYCAVGLLLLNLDFIPKPLQPIGWVLVVPGLLTLVLMRNKR
jgi:hypothetical protein